MLLEAPAARRLRGAKDAGMPQVLVDAGLVVVLLQPEIRREKLFKGSKHFCRRP